MAIKIKKIIFIIISLTVVLILALGSLQRVAINRPLSDNELEHYIKEKNIDPIAVKNVGNQFTVILFENEKEIGYYAVAINEKGKVTYSGGITNYDIKASKVWVGGAVTGTPFLGIVINDTEILSHADKILVRFKDGYQINETVSKAKGFIITGDNAIENQGVELMEIYDKDSKVLYKYP